MKKDFKQNNAITLIALVITIIVLLILAGVTIVTLTGDNGLITKASDAQKETLKAEGLEKIQVEIAGSYDNNGQIDTNQLRTNLQHISGLTTENDEPITNNTEIKLPMLVKINNNQYLIKADGSTKAKYGIDEYDVATHPETYYGHYVTNYNSPNDAGIQNEDGQLGKWQIFMADDDNIFLIASNYITRKYTGTKNNVGFDYDTENQTPETATKMWFSNILGQYNANSNTTDIPQILSKLDKQSIYHKWMNNINNQKRNYSNEKAVASMLDTEVWNLYNNSTYAKYSIGGPTLEMFCKAYNETRVDGTALLEAKETNNDNNYGYRIEKGTSAPTDSVSGLKKGAKTNTVNLDNCYFKLSAEGNCYWLASPSVGFRDCGVLDIHYDGSVYATNSYYYSAHIGFRPLVCLNANVHLVQNSDGQTYSLELN